MRHKEERPTGLLESFLGQAFPTKISVDSLNNTQKLFNAVCEENGRGGCGLFNIAHPVPTEKQACVREVPKLIQVVWLDHALPEKYAANIADVMRKNPDRTLMLWVNEAAKDVSTLTAGLTDDEQVRLLVKSVEENADRFRNWDIIEKEPNVGGRSDLIRLEVVNLYGGIYMDTDAHPQYGFSEYGSLFRWPFVAYSDPKGAGNLCNCVFGAEKQSPLMNLTIEGWRDTFFNFGVGSAPPMGCPVLTASFKTYNNPEILMLAEWYMFQRHDGHDPVMTMSFDRSWLKEEKEEHA